MQNSLRLLVLVPHRDVRIPLRAWSASLFSSGLCGAWSFPWVMPVAEISRQLSGRELKSLALMFRREVNLSGGKFITGEPAAAAISDNVSVFGPSVNIALSDSFFAFEDNAVIRRILPSVIGCALCQSGTPPDVSRPHFSFRSAALANMSFRPLPSPNGAQHDLSFEWEIEKLHWLPKN